MEEKILHQTVVHKFFGEGEIVAFEESSNSRYLTVSFSQKTSKFPFPACFENFLTMKNPELQKEMEKLIAPVEEPKPTKNATAKQIEWLQSVPKMTKDLAVSLFRKSGYDIKNVTYATKNETQNFYWSNPKFTLLDKDWFIILNDNLERKMHLFHIPAYSIHKSELKERSDYPFLAYIEIEYHNPEFRDLMSGFRFDTYYVTTMKY